MGFQRRDVYHHSDVLRVLRFSFLKCSFGVRTLRKCGDYEQIRSFPLSVFSSQLTSCKPSQGIVGIDVGSGVFGESGFDLFQQFGEFGPFDDFLHFPFT